MMVESITERALRQVIVEYQKYVNAGDAQGYASLFAEDVIWMPPNALDRIGKSEVFKAEAAAFSKFKFNVELTPTEVRALSEEWGMVLCSVRGVLTPRGEGDIVQILFRIVFVLARQPDSSWRIFRQIWNNKPQEGAPKTGGPW